MVSFFEQVGGVLISSRLSEHGMVKTVVADLAVTMRSDTPSCPRKAPQFFVTMVVALELAIVDPDRTRYERLAAWSSWSKSGLP